MSEEVLENPWIIDFSSLFSSITKLLAKLTIFDGASDSTESLYT